jgi:sugar phosphate isomerase/epimerase
MPSFGYGVVPSIMKTKNPIAYITANLVARPVGFNMTGGWMQGDSATSDLFRSTEHFADRFEDLIVNIKSLGFTSIDLWAAQLLPSWATVRQLETASSLIAKHGVTITSYPCHWGSTVEDLRLIKRVMDALGTDLISGNHGLLATDRPTLVKELRALKLRLAYENHPEKTGEAMLAKIGPGDEDVLGLAYDTGWAVTNGFDAVAALPAMLPRLFHIHAKDVKPRRTGAPTGYQLIDMGHETCTLGDGVSGIEQVIRQAVAGGFTGPIGIEHEPEHYDPAAECKESLVRVQRWLS